MPSSSTSSTRLRALRVARVVGLLGRLDREPVHHLDRGRQDPGRDDRRDGLAGLVDRVEGGELRRHGLGLAQRSRSVISVAIPSVPSEPMNAPEQVGAVRVERLAAELDDLAVGKHDRQAGDVVRR